MIGLNSKKGKHVCVRKRLKVYKACFKRRATALAVRNKLNTINNAEKLF